MKQLRNIVTIASAILRRQLLVLAVLFLAVAFSAFCTASYATLMTTHVDASNTAGVTMDGNVSSSEYSGYSYTGGGSGFGGTLGNGTLFFESDVSSLFIGANINGDLGGNIIAVYLDTQSGGFSDDSSMNDTGDTGRNVASNLTRDVQDNFPIQADFVLEFGNGFTNVFELTSGTLNFIAPTSAGTGGNGSAGGREASIPLSTLGLSEGDNVDFFAVLISQSNYSSDEGIPATGFTGNPGYGSAIVNWGNNHRFTTAIPEPTAAIAIPFALAVTGLGTVVLRRLRRREGQA